MISKLNGNEIYDNRMPVAFTRKIYKITLPIGKSSLKCRAAVVGDHVYITNFYGNLLEEQTSPITSLNINWASRQYNDNELPLPISDSVPYAYYQSDIQAQVSSGWNMNPHPDEHYAVGLTVNRPAFQIILNALPDDWGALDLTDLQQALEYSRQSDQNDGTYGAFIAKYESSSDGIAGYTSGRSSDRMGLGFHVYGYLDGTTCQMTNLGSAYFWSQVENNAFIFNQSLLSFVELSPNCACNVAFEFKGTVEEFYKKYVSTSKEYLTYTADGDFQFDTVKISFDSIQIPDLIIPDAVTDADGNTYSAVILGNQVWMAENLRTTHTANSDIITSGTNEVDGEVPYYYHLNNESDNDTTYGLLYNFPAAMIASPIGWHLPSDEEWTALTDYVKTQGTYVSGDSTENIAKALASTTNWNSSTDPDTVGNTPNQNNTTGFNAIPAGYFNSSFSGAGFYAYFWSSSQYSSYGAWLRHLYYRGAGVSRYNDNEVVGRSVRCICNQSPQEFLFNWLLNHNGYYKISKPNGFEYKLLTTSDVDKIFICNGNGVYEPITISELKAKLDSLS